ncbi:hypothetical protein PI124_g9418 [Phytophthora idaei]|nr:hypothetical protein PI125_g9192 [Phytophthora idaei]KAG3245850.1 hypothetical protein PI124_g9418 [Phytophthora idaei]
MAQADEDEDAEALVLLEVVCAVVIAATTVRLKGDNEIRLTVTKLDFDALLASTSYDARFGITCAVRSSTSCVYTSFSGLMRRLSYSMDVTTR